MNLNEAISKHIEWKVKFLSAILKQERMDIPNKKYFQDNAGLKH